MDPNRPITTDLRHLSLTANNITAKLTNQCTQTGLSTFDWQQPFTWLWWWLPPRLSKRQSPLPTTVLVRTTLTRTITLLHVTPGWVRGFKPFTENTLCGKGKIFPYPLLFSALIECDISAHFCPKFDYFVICLYEVDLQKCHRSFFVQFSSAIFFWSRRQCVEIWDLSSVIDKNSAFG